MSRRTIWMLAVLFAFNAPFPAPATGGPDKKKDAEIAWLRDLTKAFERAAAEKKVLMLCINARSPIGEPEEPAAKGLREVVYKDPAVVKKARAFVCVLLTAGGSSDDYGELRLRLGIDGLIVSPQHIFVSPEHVDGAKPLLRKQYWSHGDGPEAVAALVAMMDKALTAYRVRQGIPDAPDEDENGAPQSAEERAAWIQKLVGLVQGADAGLRKEALSELVKRDKDGDCTSPLIGLIKTLDDDGKVEALTDVVRALGIPGLESAALSIHEVLKHKKAGVRGNAAVSLEYIGSASSVEPLLARAKREKDEKVANHIYRAVGRCGAGSATVRKKLLRYAALDKDDDFGSFGPVIGLAYFKGDAKSARALEKQLLKLGSPLQYGSHAHTFLRAAIVWCLSEIADPKTAVFLRKKVLAPLAEERSEWKGRVIAYYEAVAGKCEGRDDVQAAIDRGIQAAVWSDDARELVDACRSGRDMRKFMPKGEWGNRSEDD